MIDTKEMRNMYKDMPDQEIEYDNEGNLLFIPTAAIVRDLCDSYDELERKLKIAEDVLSRLREITYPESENGRDCIVLIEEALKQIRGDE